MSTVKQSQTAVDHYNLNKSRIVYQDYDYRNVNISIVVSAEKSKKNRQVPSCLALTMTPSFSLKKNKNPLQGKDERCIILDIIVIIV